MGDLSVQQDGEELRGELHLTKRLNAYLEGRVTLWRGLAAQLAQDVDSVLDSGYAEFDTFLEDWRRDLQRMVDKVRLEEERDWHWRVHQRPELTPGG